MPAPVKLPRLVSLLLAAALLAALVGCGSSSSGAGSDSTDPASLAPPDSLFYFGVTRPEGKAAANVEALAKEIAGIDDLGGLIISELENASFDGGNELDYGKEIEPWLGDRAAFFPRAYDGDDFTEGGGALQTTDPAAAEEFLKERVAGTDEPPREESYEGVDYYVDPDDASVIGVVGNFLAYAEDEQTFEAMVDASDGESLADDERFGKAISEVPKNSLANVWVDIGGIVEQDGEIDSETEAGLAFLGIDPEGATAVASAIPGSDRIEIDLSSDVVDVQPASDNSFLLGSMPGDSVVAVATSEVGKTFGDTIDRLDREGIPEEDIPPHELKDFFKQVGIDLESISSSVTNAASFLEGSGEENLGGAAVLITAGAAQSRKIVDEVGAYLRVADVPGVTPIDGKLLTGFSISNPDLGDQPLVVAADDGIHVVVSYGLHAIGRYFSRGEELSDNPVFEEATASLGGIPISGFAQGPAALRLALGLVSEDDREGLFEAKPYLSKIDFLALGDESTDELAKAKLVVGIGE
jgi:hypothetical protein